MLSDIRKMTAGFRLILRRFDGPDKPLGVLGGRVAPRGWTRSQNQLQQVSIPAQVHSASDMALPHRGQGGHLLE